MADETKVTEELTQAPEAVQAAAPEEAPEAVQAAAPEEAPETVQAAASEEAPETASAEAPAAPVESMADYEAELNASLKQIHEGDVLTGTVIGVSDTEVILDLKYYTEGVIRVEDFTDDPNFNVKEEVHIGDEISATVVRRDGGQGQIMLSRKEANDVLAWDRLQTLMEKQTIIKTKVAGVVKAGVVVYVEGIRGFVPASKLSLNYVENLEEWLGKDIELRVINVDEEDKKLVLSAREILREREAEEKKARISNVEVGLVTEGTVESLQPYGAFINLGNGLSGLVHVSQISEKRIKSPAAVLKVGDTVKVKVIAVKDGKLSLSMKALQDVAAEEIQEETIELPQSEAVSTNLGSLFAKLKL